MVPYGKTDTATSLGGDGCCPGQTGHHVIPEEAVESCEGYNHAGAPTVCVEGTNNANGTHGKVHGDLYDRIDDYKKGGFFSSPRETISYGNLRDMGIASVQSIFPESKCDTKCLRAQLDAFYKDKCKKPMKAAAGVPGGGSGDQNRRKRR